MNEYDTEAEAVEVITEALDALGLADDHELVAAFVGHWSNVAGRSGTSHGINSPMQTLTTWPTRSASPSPMPRRHSGRKSTPLKPIGSRQPSASTGTTFSASTRLLALASR